MGKSMRILKLTANDVLRLSAVEITPTGDVVTLGGRNAQGKTSCLAAIEMALRGKRAMPERPIREGAQRGRIVLDLGDLLVERVMTNNSDRLVVRTPDGAIMPRPQDVLDRLFAAIAFDPLKFASQKESEQAETLRRLTGLDFAAHDSDRQSFFEQRTDVGRDLKKAQARLEAMTHHHDAPAGEVSVAALGEELARRQRQAAERARLGEVKRQKIATAQQREGDVAKAEERVRELEAELERARQHVVVCTQAQEAARQAARDALAAQTALVVDDPADVQAQLAGAEDLNRRVRQNAERARVAAEVAALQQQVDTLTREIEDLDAAKRRAIEEARFPVPGLTLTDAGVTFGGIPFAQASRAEQLRVSLAIGIAMNPELRVLLVRDGSLLDDDGLRIVAEMAAANDCQVWLEDARTSNPDAIIIENGMVKGAAAPEGEAA
jgi:energy-coupling factor transporter ATP-binding protein EcfA2